MASVKCVECGQEFDYELDECPNCGCPYVDSRRTMGANEKGKRNKVGGGYDILTTDTGSSNEKAIKTFADIVFGIAIVEGILIYLGAIGWVVYMDSSSTIWVVIGGALVLTIYILYVYLITAFLRVYANISINLHEINMKI